MYEYRTTHQQFGQWKWQYCNVVMFVLEGEYSAACERLVSCYQRFSTLSGGHCWWRPVTLFFRDYTIIILHHYYCLLQSNNLMNGAKYTIKYFWLAEQKPVVIINIICDPVWENQSYSPCQQIWFSSPRTQSYMNKLSNSTIKIS